MSVKVIGAVWDLDLSSSKQLVLLAMADHADHDGSNVFPSIGLIAWKTGYSVRQIQRIQRELVADGLLVVVKQGKFTSTSYRIDVSVGKTKKPYHGKDSLGDDNLTPPSSDIAMSPFVGHSYVTPGMTSESPTNHQLTVIEPSLMKITEFHPPDPFGGINNIDPKHLLEQAEQKTALNRLSDSEPVKESLERPPSKVPKKVPPASSEVKDALAILCYSTKDAWKIGGNAKAMGVVIRELGEQLTLEALRVFYANWHKKDFRGMKGERPEPHQVISKWLVLSVSEVDPAETKATLSTTADPQWVDDPDRPGVYIKPSQLRAREAEARHV